MHRRSSGATGTRSPPGGTCAHRAVPRPGRTAADGPAVLTKDTTVLHPDAIHTDTALPGSPDRPAHRRPSLAGRAALVAGGAAVSALLTLLPAAPDATAPSPAVPPAATTATVNTPVVRLAARPTALTLNLEAVTACLGVMPPPLVGRMPEHVV